MATNAGAEPGWGSLSSDLLVLIFRRVRLRPLLRIVRLVCRRWNVAALRSITKVPLEAPAALIALPSVTRLTMKPKPGVPATVAAVLPPRIRDLEYYSVRGMPCCCGKLRDLTGLTRLYLETNGCCREPLRLIERNTQLTELRFSMERATKEEEESLPALRLPHLRSLELYHALFSPESFAFTSAHASQLTSLYFPTMYFLSLHLEVPIRLPALRCAVVARSYHENELAPLTLVAPALGALGLTAFVSPETLPPGVLLTALTSLSVINYSTDYDGYSPWATLAEQCPNLRRLDMREWAPESLRLTQLRELRATVSDLTSIGGMRRLTRLRVALPAERWENLAALTDLRKLTICCRKLDASLEQAVGAVVRTRRLLELKLVATIPAQQWPMLCDILRLCEECGVQKFSLKPRTQAAGARGDQARAAVRWMDLQL